MEDKYEIIITHFGGKRWIKNNRLHRDERDEDGYTLPAVISKTSLAWYKDGKIHNDDIDRATGYTKPAYINLISGSKHWSKHNLSCRTDIDSITKLMLPTKIFTDEYDTNTNLINKSWLIDNRYTREEDLPYAIIVMIPEMSSYEDKTYIYIYHGRKTTEEYVYLPFRIIDNLTLNIINLI